MHMLKKSMIGSIHLSYYHYSTIPFRIIEFKRIMQTIGLKYLPIKINRNLECHR